MGFKAKQMSEAEEKAVTTAMMEELQECGAYDEQRFVVVAAFVDGEEEDLEYFSIEEAVNQTLASVRRGDLEYYRFDCPQCGGEIDVEDEDPIQCSCVCNKVRA